MKTRYALLLALLICLPGSAIDDPVAAARKEAAHGEYGRAEKAYQAILAKDPKAAEAHVGLADLRLITGKYADAEAEARKAIEIDPACSSAYGALAEALYTVGRYDDVEKVVEDALKQNDHDLRSRVMRAQARYDTGKYDALDRSKELDWFVDDFQARGEKWTEREWYWGAQGLWLYAKYMGEGTIATSLVQDMVNSEAIKTSADLIALLGMFHIEWYDMPGAKSDFRDALDINPNQIQAMLGAEMVGAQEPGQNPYEQKAVHEPRVLKVNPNFVDALCYEAQQRIGQDNYDSAIEACDRALAVNPSSVQALGYKAVSMFLHGNKGATDELVKRSLAVNPKGGDLYYVLGETIGGKRMTLTSWEYLKKGAELDPKNAQIQIALGTCEMNLGEEDDAKKRFEAAWKRNKSNTWAANYLQLLGSFYGEEGKEPDYVVKHSPHFFFRMHKSEAPWLETYATEISEECYDDYRKRYHFEPHLPVTLELFPFHNDFSARTIGLPGLPAAGACLGRVVATLSPRAKEEMGPFNWGAVLWHEVGHVFAVQLSNEKVPRWFTEGLSTYEEKRRVEGWEFSGGGGWSSELRLATFQNYHLGKLIPLERLNEGFGGGDIIFYYYYASLIQEYIEKTYGFEKIPEMLRKYADGKKDTEAFPEVFGIPLKQFEGKFHAWIRDEYLKDIKLRPPLKEAEVKKLEERAAKNIEDFEALGKLAYHYFTKGDVPKARSLGLKCMELNPKNVDGLVTMGRVYRTNANKNLKKAAECFAQALANGADDYVVHWEYGQVLEEQKENEKAIAQYEAATQAFPRFAPREDNCYKRLTALYEDAGNTDKMIETMERWAPIDYGEFKMRMKLAAAYREKGDDEKLMKILRECIWIEPMDIKLHAWLAEGYRKQKDYDKAAQELSFAVAVTQRANEKADPPGRFDNLIAGFWCDTAEVRLMQGKKDAAKDAVDQALFTVPDSERALELKKKVAR